jgi:alcohol dehydrogenase class IV
VAEQLAAEVASLGVARPLLVCGERLAKSPVLEAVRQALDASTPIFDGSRPHTPVETVEAGVAAARRENADALVAVGGSSAVDCAKGIAVLLASGRERVAELEPLSFAHLFDARREDHPTLPVLVVSTTLSFAEFLPFWGCRNAATLRKVPYGDLACVERTVFLDGSLAAHTPDDIWFETGVKALDDAISAFCRSAGPEPFLDPILRAAIAQLVTRLPASGGRDSAAVRQEVFTACWMTKLMLPRLASVAVSAWFSTAARHSMGAVCEVPHGAASCVALPEALRFHARDTRERQSVLAEAIGWDPAGEVPLAAGLDTLLQGLGAPRRLSELGVGPDALPEVVSAILAESPALGAVSDVQMACERML